MQMLPVGLSIKCSNFKCFADPEQGFDRIKPINIIIGRNNTGKTTLLDMLQYATQPQEILERGHKRNIPQVVLSWPLTADHLQKGLPIEMHAEHEGERYRFNPQDWAPKKLLGATFHAELKPNGQFQFVRMQMTPNKPRDTSYANALGPSIKSTNHFGQYTFRRLLADRNIAPEPNDPNNMKVEPNGAGVTNVIQRYINQQSLNRDVIETTLLGELNALFRPDADYARMLVQQKGEGEWEVYLDEPRKGRIPMSQMGSGLKTVLLVLANLILVPLLGKKPKPLSEYMFGFEELENNLHPAIQRRLFRYLREKALAEHCYFFITTHSSVVIDLFSSDDEAQIIHVTHDGERLVARIVETSPHGWDILDDLDVRASDLLQANAIVWVEGSSDRVYFEKWIELWSDGKLVKGIHYQCLPYGGSLGADLSMANPDIVDTLNPALKINRHAIFLADSDRRADGDDLKPHTKRLAEEVQAVSGYAWITDGKEVENYIPAATFQKIYNNPALETPGKYDNVLEFVETQDGKRSRHPKPDLAHRVADVLTIEAIADTLDMPLHLDEVCALLKKWNRLDG